MKHIGIVIPDTHFPLQDDRAMNIVYQAIDIVKPDIFISLGDLTEAHNVSPWKYKRRARPPLEYQLPMIDEEIIQVNHQIDKLDQALDAVGCDTRYVTTGNHDQWWDFFALESHPYLAKDYTFKAACKMDERGWEVIPYNRPLSIGKLNMIHGFATGPGHTRKTLNMMGTNVLYGHTHDIMRFSQCNYNEDGIMAQSLGCLKDMNPDKNKFVRSGIMNWNHCFGIITWFDDDSFQLDVQEITNKGKVNIWGQIIE